MNRKKVLKNKVKGKLKTWVTAGSSSDNYGFGSNWNLNIGTKDKTVKSMWLGQGAKVTSRMLGYHYGDYVKNVSERANAKKQFQNEKEWLSNKKVNKLVSGDILEAIGETNPKNLLNVEDWDLAVQ